MKETTNDNMYDYDYIIIGSGFGGSVSAHRLSQKGYKVLVMEKGKWFKATDFPKTNWNLRRWFWAPSIKLLGFFKLTFFRHVGVAHGVGVGGGSLVYANTLPVPGNGFFEASSWQHLGNWKNELEPHYKTALTMLGATKNPEMMPGDLALKAIATDLNKEKDFHPTNVAVFFGTPIKQYLTLTSMAMGPNAPAAHIVAAA